MQKLTQYKKVLFGTVLAIVAGVVSFSAWSQTPAIPQDVVVQKGPTLSQEGILNASYHAGKRTLFVPYLEDSTLYLSEIDKQGLSPGTEVSQKKIAEGVNRLFGMNENTGQFLYQVREKGKSGGEDFSGVGLWIGDSDGNTREVYRGVTEATLSPSGTRIAISDAGFNLRIIDLQGNILATIPGHGGRAIFSPDGTKIAYQMLSDSGPFTDTWFLGLTVYDLTTGREHVVATDSGDYGVVEFSPDASKLYFLKSGKEDPSVDDINRGDLFVFDMEEEKGIVNLTSSVKNFRPHLPVKKNSSGEIFYFRGEEGVTGIKFSLLGVAPEVQKLKDVSAFFWLEKDKKLIVRMKGTDGKEYWQPVNVQ